MNYYFNSKQWQNKLNKTNRTKKNKKNRAYLGHLPQPTWPSPPCQSIWRPSPPGAPLSSTSAYWQRRVDAPVPGPPPPASPWQPPRHPRDATETPRASPRSPHSLWTAPPLLWLSLPSLPCEPRAQPSPLFAIAAATGHPTQSRRAQKLRHVVFFIFDEPRKPGGPETSPSPSSSTSGSDHRRR